MSKKTELIKNTFIIAIGKISTQMITFFLLPLYTIFLSPTEYGFFDLTITYILLFTPIITIQFEMAVFRFLIDARNDEDAQINIISNTLRTLVILLITFTIIAVSINALINIPYFWLILINIIANAFAGLLMQISRGLGNNKAFAPASFITGISTMIATLFFVVFIRTGISGALISIAIANIICSTFLFIKISLYKYIRPNQHNKTTQKELRQYSLPLVPNGAALWVINVSDRTIVSIIMGIAANGIYAVSNKFALILGSISNILTMSWTESVSIHINTIDGHEFISETLNSCLILFILLGTIIIAGTPIAFPLLVGARYADAINYIPIMIICVIISNVMSLYGAIYVAKKMTKQIASTSIIAAMINIILTIIMVPIWGLYGAAIATAVAFFFITIFRHYDLKKIIIIKYDILKITLLSAFLIVVSLFHYLNQPILNILVLIISIMSLALISRRQIKFIIEKITVFFKLSSRTPYKRRVN